MINWNSTTVETATSEITDDFELITLICRGESAHFKTLYNNYERQIFSYVYGMMNYHTQDTEDICSEVWIKAFKKLPTFHFKSKFFSWVYTIAKNTTYDALRKKKQSPIMSFDTTEHLQDSTMALDELAITRDTLCRILQKIKKDDKNILLLRYIEGYKPKEIAEMLSISVNQASVQINRAAKRAKKFLQ
jgi:RNA polymerase sigma-70 factor, ECF subfamily